MIEVGTERYAEACKGMSAAATKACKYEVDVVVKGIKEEWDLPPLRATQESGRGKGEGTIDRRNTTAARGSRCVQRLQ